MSKRSRRLRNDHANDNAKSPPVGDICKAQSAEPEMVFSGQAFLQFDQWIDGELETMVEKWIHVAAPAASTVRRLFPQSSRRTSQA